LCDNILTYIMQSSENYSQISELGVQLATMARLPTSYIAALEGILVALETVLESLGIG
jgi:C4-type Zn-finger protein